MDSLYALRYDILKRTDKSSFGRLDWDCEVAGLQVHLEERFLELSNRQLTATDTDWRAALILYDSSYCPLLRGLIESMKLPDRGSQVLRQV